MNILAIDISGKVIAYDKALFEAIVQEMPTKEQVLFACPYFCISNVSATLSLISLIPERFRHTGHFIKRAIKFIEGIINLYLIRRYIRRNTVDILHLQWLPFLEVCGIEKYWLYSIHRISPATKIILTQHNIYPHNSSSARTLSYQTRMKKLRPWIHQYIVHNHSTAQRLSEEFQIPLSSITVIHHGIFIPVSLPARTKTTDKIRILQFGQQSAYKGTDILIKAITTLSPDIRKRLDVHIVGYTDPQLYHQYISEAQQLNIYWNPHFVSDEVIYQELQDADLITFPYRSISQSGALLSAIAFLKPLIVSDLPAFKETLGDDYPSEFIVHAGDAHSLAEAIRRYVCQPDDNTPIHDLLALRVMQYSWSGAALQTIGLYQKLLPHGTC